MNHCPFCPPQIKPHEIILENELCIFLKSIDPVLTAAGLIVPRRHAETVFDLSVLEWQATYDLLQQAKALIHNKYQPDGFNVGWNVGYAGGQDVFHAHLHVIARFADEPLAGKGLRHWIKQENNRRAHS
jgi:diadenosine tetraphosphate (Ap4A) HIT family hydrolase